MTRSKVSTRKKGKTVRKIKKVQREPVSVNTADPLYQQLQSKKRHQLRTIAEKYGVSPYSKSKTALVNRIYRAMKQDITLSKSKNIDRLEVENTPDGSLIAIGDNQKGYNFLVVDQGGKPVKQVRADSKDGLLEITTLGFDDEESATIVQVNPSLEQQQQLVRPRRSSKYKRPSANQVHAKLHKKMLYPNLEDKIIPEYWPDDYTRQQKKILEDYKRRNIVPFMFPRGAKDYVSFEQLNASLPVVDIVSEKSTTELEKKFKGKSVHSTEGNNIQTQIFTAKQGDKLGKWVGFYTQPKGKPVSRKGRGKNKLGKLGVPAPTLAIPKEAIYVDDDNAGHFIAYVVNSYAYGEPFKKNVYFSGRKQTEPTRANKVRVNRFLAKSITDSLALRQNDALNDALKLDLGADALKYRREGDVTQLNLSEQLLQITGNVYLAMYKTNVEVTTLFSKFDFEGVTVEPFKEEKPVLYFKPDSVTSKKVRRLDSDTLLRVAVRKYDLEPDSAQAMLESLHNRGWISYPRTDIEKATDEPIELLRPIDAKIKGKWSNDASYNKKFEAMLGKMDEKEKKSFELGFSGTSQEREVLELVKSAEISFKRDENFVQDGVWILESGDKKLSVEGDLIAGEQSKYTDDEFDIQLAKRGISPLKLTNYITKNNIGTPATRTSEISKLKSAGILSLKDGRYILDTRGLYLVATLRVIQEENIPTAIELQEKIRNAHKVEQFHEIINQYVLLDREYLAKRIEEEAQAYIEAEADFSYLDSF